MTPTLLGRWQTRLLLLATVGVLVTLIFTVVFLGSPIPAFFWILFYVALFGLVWDVVYQQIQKSRWDADWPGALQLFAGIWEGFFVVLVGTLIGLPGVPKADFPLGWFILHYSLVWLAIYIASQSVMRILFPRWRFRGGQLNS